jgi:hypothetical protein
MFVTGGLVGLLLYLEQQKILSIDIERLQVTSSFIFTSVASSFDNMTQIDGLTSLGIPLTASMTAGFTVGFMKA